MHCNDVLQLIVLFLNMCVPPLWLTAALYKSAMQKQTGEIRQTEGDD